MAGYRAEIDGLRAVAIVPVVLFHFGAPGFGGGFVGVDVFFVISGFLIGGLLYSELCNTGRIQLKSFFFRRIRRLAPAYFTMASACVVAGWFILLPFEYDELGRELITATAYLSNVYFWDEAVYFDVLGDSRVLLHTWSLAVEEQFYLFLPLLLILLARLRQMIPIALFGLAIASLFACIVVTPIMPDAAFYLLPFRIWELLAGVLLAVIGRDHSLTWSLHGTVSWGGLGLILAAVVLLEPGRGFPGAAAILPVLGAVMIIANGKHENAINRILQTRPFLFFGAISYSLYLWHWPILVLANYATGDDLGVLARAGLGAASVALAYGSFRLVETPFRRGGVSHGLILTGYGAASAAVVAIAAFLVFTNGLIERFDRAFWPYIVAARDTLQDVSRCHVSQDSRLAGLEICPIGPDGPPRLLVWGDSHASAYRVGLERLAFESGTPVLLVWRNSCPPLLGVYKEDSRNPRFEMENCFLHNETVAHAMENVPSLNAVLLVARWTYYANGQGVGRDDDNTVSLMTSEAEAGTGEPQGKVLGDALLRTVSAVKSAGLETFILRQAPEIFDFSARDAARALVYRQKTLESVRASLGTTELSELERRNSEVDAVFSGLGVPIIDSWPIICGARACTAFHDGKVIYSDNNHLNNTGSLEIREIFQPAFDAANRSAERN